MIAACTVPGIFSPIAGHDEQDQAIFFHPGNSNALNINYLFGSALFGTSCALDIFDGGSNGENPIKKSHVKYDGHLVLEHLCGGFN